MATPLPLSTSFRGAIDIEHWAYTAPQTTMMNYTWIIDDFDSKTISLTSSALSTGGCNYFIMLNMHEVNSVSDNGYYSLGYSFPYVLIFPIVMKSTFSIIDSNGEKVRSLHHQFKKIDANSDASRTFITRRDLMTNKDQLLPSNRLTLLCEITVIAEGQTISGQRVGRRITIPKTNLRHVLEIIYANKKHCDVEFIVGLDGVKIQAHKAILIARSSVFLATFENDMAEKKTNEVMISHFSSDVFDAMLKYIYTDKVENLDDMARDLLAIANYYDLERLKIMCAESLYRNLTITNAAETLCLADLYNVNTLKTYTQHFMMKYAKEFIQTAGFLTMKEENSDLAFETLMLLTNNPMVCPVVSEMDNLLLKAELSDITLVVDGEELQAHKVILAAQSPVFAESFKAPSTTPNRLVIKNIQSVIMREVLTFIYTGQLKEAHDVQVLLKVLAASKTYQIKELKALCARELLKKLAIDTAVPILIGTDGYDVPELSKRALDFIQTNKPQILLLDNFKDLCNKKPELLFKILSLDIKK